MNNTATIIDMLAMLPAKYADGVEYYYRRGNIFYFRTPVKKERFTIRCKGSYVDELRNVLVIGEVYKSIV